MKPNPPRHRIATLLGIRMKPKGCVWAARVSFGVEAVEKPQNCAFSRQKVLCFQGSTFSKGTFSTASLGCSTPSRDDVFQGD
jgi:hypothetical protein